MNGIASGSSLQGMAASGDVSWDAAAEGEGCSLEHIYSIIEKNVHQIPVEWLRHDAKRANQIALNFFMEDVYKKYEKKYFKEGTLDFYGYVSEINTFLIRFAGNCFSKYIDQVNKSKNFVSITDGSEHVLLPIENRYCESYQYKVQKRMKWLCYQYGNAHAVMLTLTIDPDVYKNNKLRMWQDIKPQYHRFITALKYHFKKSNRVFPKYLCTIEAQKNGNPHLHIVFLNATRLLDWKQIRKLWNLGHIFINRTKQGNKIRYPINYIAKYITKTYTETNKDNILSQSLCWLFNIRSFSNSRGLIIPLKPLSSGEWTSTHLIIIDFDIEKIDSMIYTKIIDIISNPLNPLLKDHWI